MLVHVLVVLIYLGLGVEEGVLFEVFVVYCYGGPEIG